MFRFIRKSFVRRLTCWYLAIFVAALLFAGHHIARTLEVQTIDRLIQTLHLQANYTHYLLKPYLGDSLQRKNIQLLMESMAEDIDTRITVVDLSGMVLGDTEVDWNGLIRMDNHASRPEIRVALDGQIGRKTRYSQTLKTRMLYVARPLLKNDEIVGVIRMAMPAIEAEQMLKSVRQQVLATTVFGIGVILILGLLMSRSFNKRISRLKFAASEFASGKLTETVDIGGEDEIQELAGSMNFMANNLKQKIKQIEVERIRFKAILQNIAEGVVAVNADLQIQIMNPTAESMFGISDRQAAGQPLLEVVQNTRADDLVREAIRKKEVIQKELEFIQDQVRTVKLSAVGLSESHEGVAAIVVFYDITDFKRLETIRKDFVANASHELKTPLTSIRGFVEMLKQGALNKPAQAIKFLEIIEEDANRLTRLTDDLLELSKAESNQEPTKQLIDLREIFEATVASLDTKITQRNLKVQYAFNEAGSYKIMANADQIKQVAINLVDNAIKYNRQSGQLIISMMCQSGEITVAIKDTGEGIAPEAIPRLFERFYRVDPARSRELGGTGLGLAIVKHIIEAHGGTIQCESVLSKGTTFTFRLPI